MLGVPMSISSDTCVKESGNHLGRRQTSANQCTITTLIDSPGEEGPPTTGPAIDSLSQLIHRLPQELFDQIQETVFDLAFCPGFVFPHRQNNQGFYDWNGKHYKTARPQLLCISKAIHKKYQTRIFSENVVVMAPGRVHRTLALVGLTSEGRPPVIRRAYVIFSNKDWSRVWAEIVESQAAFPPEQYTNPYAKLVGRRIAKYESMMKLPLAELTLDFTECYGPHNRWLGEILAMWIHQRVPTAPADLRIIAPDDTKRHCIYAILAGPTKGSLGSSLSSTRC